MSWAVTISGTTRAVKADDLSVSLALGQRGTARFSYFDEVGDDLPDKNAEVTVADPEGLRVFGGTVTRFTKRLLNENQQSVGSARHVSVECRDFVDIAYRRIVWLLAEDMTTGDIARALGAYVNTHGAEGLGLSDIAGGSGVLLEGQVFFDGVYLSEALDFLARQEGGYWTIDAHRSLRFGILQSPVAAPFSVSEANHPIFDIEASESIARFRNVQFVFGSPSGIGALHTETPENDATGGLTVVPTNYPVYSVESLTDTDGTTTLTVSKEGEDPAADAWFVPGQKNIRLASPAGAGGSWTVSYNATRRVMGYAEDESSALYRKHEKLHINENLATDAHCQREAEGLLAQHGPSVEVTYQTHEHGLRPGQAQSFVLPALDVNSSLLIESVSFGKLPSADNEAARYRVRLTSGQSQIEQALQALARRDESMASGEGEKLDQFAFKNDNIGVGAAVVIAEV